MYGSLRGVGARGSVLSNFLNVLLIFGATFVKHFSNSLEMLSGHGLQVATFGGRSQVDGCKIGSLCKSLQTCQAHSKQVFSRTFSHIHLKLPF